MEKQDAIDLLVAVGQQRGFDVMCEYPVIAWDTHTHGRIDCAWFERDQRRPSAVFEVEGINVYRARRSLEKDLWKFKWSDAPHKVVLLYTHRLGIDLVPDMDVAVDRVRGCLAALNTADPQQVVEVLCFPGPNPEVQLAQHIEHNWQR